MTAQSDYRSQTKNFVHVEVAPVATIEAAWRLSLAGDIFKYSLAEKGTRTGNGALKCRHKLRLWYYEDLDIRSEYSLATLKGYLAFSLLMLQPKPLVLSVLTQPRHYVGTSDPHHSTSIERGFVWVAIRAIPFSGAIAILYPVS